MIAAFLRDSTVRRLLTLSVLELMAPEFLRSELAEHLPELQRRAGLSEAAARNVLERLEKYIDVIPTEASLIQWDRAIGAVESIDSGDVAYVATALAVRCDGIWSDDPHLKRQNVVECWTTRELLDALRDEGLKVQAALGRAAAGSGED